MMSGKKYRTRSTGEMISTFCFAGMALWFASEAMLYDKSIWGKIGLWASSLSCALATVRFPLQQLVDRFRR